MTIVAGTFWYDDVVLDRYEYEYYEYEYEYSYE